MLELQADKEERVRAELMKLHHSLKTADSAAKVVTNVNTQLKLAR